MRLVAGLLVLFVAGCGGGDRVLLRVLGEDGQVELEIHAEIARSPVERTTGLKQWGERIELDEGLLIELPLEDDVCISNEGVAFAIDAIFVDGDANVTAIERNLAADSAETLCHDHIHYIVEVGSGVADEVNVGSRLDYADLH